ncbi:MAG: nitroreductase family protein [Nibricoccus sp.]
MKSGDTLTGTLLPELATLAQERRATMHFLDEPVPQKVIEAALEFAAQAPSGYNAQPWRFLVLRDKAQREALKKAAFDQPKIGEAPVMIVAFASPRAWKERFTAVQSERARRLGLDPGSVKKQVDSALAFIGTLNPAVWLNRQVMIAFTYLMLGFEAQGWDTAPMEGLDGPSVKKALSLPEDAEVMALLAVGRSRDANQAHPGRLSVSEIAFAENLDKPWQNTEGHRAEP